MVKEVVLDEITGPTVPKEYSLCVLFAGFW
jgi:hypothetical protein